MDNIKLVAPCLFGTESILADELRRMGIEKVSAENGRVLFEGELNLLARANINSRFGICGIRLHWYHLWAEDSSAWAISSTRRF